MKVRIKRNIGGKTSYLATGLDVWFASPDKATVLDTRDKLFKEIVGSRTTRFLWKARMIQVEYVK